MGPRVWKHESWTKYYFLNIKIISIIFTPLMRITCKRKSYIWTKSNKETWGDLILFAELSKFSSLRNHAGQKWCICCCLLCLENHASGSGFSKKVFLIQSNGCKRGKKKKGSGSQWKRHKMRNRHKNRHQQRKLRPITKHKLSKHCTSSY